MAVVVCGIGPDVGGRTVKSLETPRSTCSPEHAAAGARKRILLVEDDAAQSMLYERELTRAGYEVLVAHDGLEAIMLCESAQPDLVIMDIGMPRMDGIDAMDRLLAHNHRVRVILYTSYPAYGDNYRSWSADAYVVKSSDMAELKQKILEVLDSSAETAP